MNAQTQIVLNNTQTSVSVGDFTVMIHPKDRTTWEIPRDQIDEFKKEVIRLLEQRGMKVHRFAKRSEGMNDAQLKADEPAVVLATATPELIALKEKKMDLRLHTGTSTYR
eukprot:SAG11_NODE_2711_length_3056_cov_1.984782_6_plen_109_part_01